MEGRASPRRHRGRVTVTGSLLAGSVHLGRTRWQARSGRRAGASASWPLTPPISDCRSNASTEEQVSGRGSRPRLRFARSGARPVVRPLRHRDHRPGVARSHECREGATSIYRGDPEARRLRKQVSACCAAQTCNASESMHLAARPLSPSGRCQSDDAYGDRGNPADRRPHSRETVRTGVAFTRRRTYAASWAIHP